MKQSEIRAKGKKIIETVFAGALNSKEKEVWKRAIAGAQNHVAKLKAMNDPETLWVWESALSQLANKFGNKFIEKR